MNSIHLNYKSLVMHNGIVLALENQHFIGSKFIGQEDLTRTFGADCNKILWNFFTPKRPQEGLLPSFRDAESFLILSKQLLLSSKH